MSMERKLDQDKEKYDQQKKTYDEQKKAEARPPRDSQCND
jgi:hypothetical protein